MYFCVLVCARRAPAAFTALATLQDRNPNPYHTHVHVHPVKFGNKCSRPMPYGE